MQQNQSSRHFSETKPQQPVYRFPQNQSVQGWQTQQQFSVARPDDEPIILSHKEQKKLNRLHRARKRRILTLWNLFAVIGIITTIVQAMRYVIIPLLLYLNILAGGGV